LSPENDYVEVVIIPEVTLDAEGMALKEIGELLPDIVNVPLGPDIVPFSHVKFVGYVSVQGTLTKALSKLST
jgi:hypothetical protein